uniref:Uncharacterized protein n=1 Tax=Candidatus Kentrum sp. LFY TaxID=2126342 RepID=A0A450UAM2_9GAMM|nr:MAG: hypothetical protein BECKLFY1418A_GA0070994_100637 [Candidatus Kentron sp. LFY]
MGTTRSIAMIIIGFLCLLPAACGFPPSSGAPPNASSGERAPLDEQQGFRTGALGLPPGRVSPMRLLFSEAEQRKESSGVKPADWRGRDDHFENFNLPSNPQPGITR